MLLSILRIKYITNILVYNQPVWQGFGDEFYGGKPPLFIEEKLLRDLDGALVQLQSHVHDALLLEHSLLRGQTVTDPAHRLLEVYVELLRLLISIH